MIDHIINAAIGIGLAAMLFFWIVYPMARSFSVARADAAALAPADAASAPPATPPAKP